MTYWIFAYQLISNTYTLYENYTYSKKTQNIRIYIIFQLFTTTTVLNFIYKFLIAQ